jgi:hypothetical protein
MPGKAPMGDVIVRLTCAVVPGAAWTLAADKEPTHPDGIVPFSANVLAAQPAASLLTTLMS